MKNNGLKISIGGSSIILILVVFALSVFAVLSIRSSNNELNMAEKSAESIKEYYAADSKAEEILCKIDEELYTDASIEKIRNIDDSIEITDEEGLLYNIEYRVPIREGAEIYVKLYINMESEIKYSIISWEIEQEDSGEYEIVIPDLWDGDIGE